MRGDRAAGVTGVQKTVAVLPFDNVGGDAGIDYLRLALADEVATALSATPSLAVRPMASSRRFAGGEGSPQAAGRELRVDRIVIGHFSIHQSDCASQWKPSKSTATGCSGGTPSRRGRLTRSRSAMGSRRGSAMGCCLHWARGHPRFPMLTPERRRVCQLPQEPRALERPRANREAIAILERASTIDPDHADTWASLGRRYYDEGRTVPVGAKRSGDRKRRSGTR